MPYALGTLSLDGLCSAEEVEGSDGTKDNRNRVLTEKDALTQHIRRRSWASLPLMAGVSFGSQTPPPRESLTEQTTRPAHWSYLLDILQGSDCTA